MGQHRQGRMRGGHMQQSPGLDPHLCPAVLWVPFPRPGLDFGQAPGTRGGAETNQGLLAVSSRAGVKQRLEFKDSPMQIPRQRSRHRSRGSAHAWSSLGPAEPCGRSPEPHPVLVLARAQAQNRFQRGMAHPGHSTDGETEARGG